MDSKFLKLFQVSLSKRTPLRSHLRFAFRRVMVAEPPAPSRTGKYCKNKKPSHRSHTEGQRDGFPFSKQYFPRVRVIPQKHFIYLILDCAFRSALLGGAERQIGSGGERMNDNILSRPGRKMSVRVYSGYGFG